MQPDFYPTLVQRLGSGEFVLCVNSLSLINAMMRHVSDEYRNDFHENLEGLNLRRAVSLLMNSHLGQELSKQVLEFQSLIIRQLHEWKQTPISLDNIKHREALDTVWQKAGVEQDDFAKWRRIGFATEAPKWEMSKVGYLGLDHMRLFALRDEDLFAKIILEQVNRPENRRCPICPNQHGGNGSSLRILGRHYWFLHVDLIPASPLVLFSNSLHHRQSVL